VVDGVVENAILKTTMCCFS